MVSWIDVVPISSVVHRFNNLSVSLRAGTVDGELGDEWEEALEALD